MREAISYALDRNAIIDGASAGLGVPIGSHMSPANKDYVDLTGRYPQDVAKAQALLKEAGSDRGPITIRAEATGGVEINGTEGFHLEAPAAYIVIKGFKFTHTVGGEEIAAGANHWDRMRVNELSFSRKRSDESLISATAKD